MWSAFGLAAIGCTVGLVANLVWLARAWRHTLRPSRLDWLRTAVNVLLGVAFVWIWFGR